MLEYITVARVLIIFGVLKLKQIKAHFRNLNLNPSVDNLSDLPHGIEENSCRVATFVICETCSQNIDKKKRTFC